MSSKTRARVWQRRPVRVLAGLLLFGVALAAQYRLAAISEPVNLSETGRFAPVSAKLGQAELIVEGPSVNSPGGVLFAHDGGPNEIVDVRFERARLGEDTARMLAALGDTVPEAPTAIDYRPDDESEQDAGREPCRTFARVAWGRADQPPTALRLFQVEAPGLERYRYLEVEAAGGELAVQLLPAASGADPAPEASGCPGRLRIGELEEQLTEGVGFTVVAAPGSKFRWHFRPRTQGPPPWGGADGLFEPFTLGTPQVREADAPPLRARAVRVRPLGGAADAPDILSARSTDDGPPLTLSSLKVGSDQLQLSVAGTAWVEINGAPLTVNLFERLEKNRLLAALLGMGNATLLALIGRLVLGKRKQKPAAEQDSTTAQN